MRILLTFFLLLIPHVSFAEVVINEVAWMGTAVSANDEWIELYNDGESTDLSGWILTDNDTLLISLSGSLASGGYFLLERTDDETVSGVTADVIYTGALSNEGKTLVLKNASGATEDSVSGGEGWSSISGDNVTKETAQRTSSGWTTGTPTPKKQNVGYTERVSESTNTSPTQENVESSKSTPASSKKNSQAKVALQNSNTKLAVSIDGGAYAYVNQPAVFYAEARGVSDQILENIVFHWSFGDATSGRGEKITHTFTHAGTYAVVVRAGNATHEAYDRLNVEVLPIGVTLWRTEAGDVTVRNMTSYEADISNMLITAGDFYFRIPDHTVLLSGSSLPVPQLLFRGLPKDQNFTLSDRSGKILATYPIPLDAPKLIAAANSSEEILVETDELDEEETISRVIEVPEEAEQKGKVVEEIADFSDTQVAAVAESIPENTVNNRLLAYLGLFGVILISFIGLYIGMPRRNQEGFYIVTNDDSSDSMTANGK